MALFENAFASMAPLPIILISKPSIPSRSDDIFCRGALRDLGISYGTAPFSTAAILVRSASVNLRLLPKCSTSSTGVNDILRGCAALTAAQSVVSNN